MGSVNNYSLEESGKFNEEALLAMDTHDRLAQ